METPPQLKGDGASRQSPPRETARGHGWARGVLLAQALGLLACLVQPLPRYAAAAEPRALAEHQVQALYIYNFTRYVDWPESAFASKDAPFEIGLIESEELRRDLQEIIQGKTVGDRLIRVQAVATDAELKHCHLLFINSRNKKELGRILAIIGQRPILTVGVSEDFLELGGVIRLSRKNSKLDLAINTVAGRQTHLSISAKLMAVAERTQGIPK